MSRRRTASLAVLLAALVALAGMQAGTVLAGPATSSAPKFLEWRSMVGVTQAFTGTAVPQLNIRGILGGGIPWTLTKGKGSLRTDGHLKVKVDGLVLATTLSNPVTSFRATVSCLNAAGETVNVPTTDAFPATTGLASEGGGDATIEADLMLPQPCIAPIVFVTSPTGAWFASTGG